MLPTFLATLSSVCLQAGQHKRISSPCVSCLATPDLVTSPQRLHGAWKATSGGGLITIADSGSEPFPVTGPATGILDDDQAPQNAGKDGARPS